MQHHDISRWRGDVRDEQIGFELLIAIRRKTVKDLPSRMEPDECIKGRQIF